MRKMKMDKAVEMTFPPERRCPLQPPEAYAEARKTERLVPARIWNGRTVWVATRYDDVMQILSDPRFSIVPTAPNFPFPSEIRAAMLLKEPPAFTQIDPPEHTRVRRMFGRMFTIKRIEENRQKIDDLSNSLIDAMLEKGPPADLHRDFSAAIPSYVMAEFLGVAHEDRPFFSEVASARFTYVGDPSKALTAGEELSKYLHRMVQSRIDSAETGDDVISELVAREVKPGNLSAEEAVVFLRALLVNGQDTTANMISMGTLLLLQNPDQLDKLKSNTEILPDAVEEMLRFVSTAHFQGPRTATEDVMIGNTLVKKGDGVVASVVAANHDPAMFANPEAFDITRDASHHVAFGYGVHQCIAQPLARLEIVVAMARLIERMPNLQMAVPFEELEFAGTKSQTYGVSSLPIKW